MISAGFGVGLLPIGTPTFPEVRLMPLTSPQLVLRAHAVARHGRLSWPPLALVTDLLAQRTATSAADRSTPPQ